MVLFKVKDLHPVLGINHDSFACGWIHLIQDFYNTFIVILSKSSLLHELNISFSREISRSSLGSIIHDSYLQILPSLVSHGYG